MRPIPPTPRFALRPAAGLLVVVLACGSRTGLLTFAIDGQVYAEDDGGTEVAPPAPKVPPRPLAPLSTAHVTRRTPTFRWELPDGISDATIDLCSDRACTRTIESTHVTGSSWAPSTPLPSGVVYWRLHPATATTMASPTWQIVVGAASAPVDTSWGTTLDVNGDGYADVVVGGINENMTESADVYLGGAAGLAMIPATTLTVPDGMDHEYTVAVSSAGDVNGDGYADVIVGTTGVADAYVYFGGPNGPDTSSAIALNGPVGIGFDYFVSAAGVGDVNGDGYGDVVVALSEHTAPGAGFAYVYLGSETGPSASPSVTLASPSGTSFWAAVASAGDVNGDGFGDVLVGSVNTPNAFVYLGGAGGPATSPATTLVGPDGGNFGYAVAGAGDVNGDGYSDVVIGAESVTNAYVYLGGPGGLGTTATTLPGPGRTGFGNSVASAGDVNGDGFADVVVGAFDASDAYVYLGSASGLATTSSTTLSGAGGTNFGNSVASAGDVNGDGYADVIVGAPLAMGVQGSASLYLGSSAGVGSSASTTLQVTRVYNELFGRSVFGATN